MAKKPQYSQRQYVFPKQVAFRLSAIVDEGQVYWKTFKPWDDFG